MKIGIDIRTLMDARPSGVSEYTLNLVKEILKLDHGNEYRLFYNCFGACPHVPEFAGENVKMVKYNYPNKIFNYPLAKFFNCPKIDQALAVDAWFMPHINFVGLSGRVKSIITVHDLSFLRHPEFFNRRKNFWHKMINVKKLLNKFDVIVAVSENTKRDIIELCGINPEKIKVIYSGIGSEYGQISNIQYPISNKISNSNNQIKSKYNLPDKFILYLGTIEPRKNVDGIIRAYNELRIMNNELRDYKLVIAGARGWKSEKIYEEWERSEFKADIIFLGYVDSHDKIYLYNLAGVFIYPSFYEGFGLPPLEAMACGVPVIASYAASLPEVAGGAALMADPYNINQLARALAAVLTDEKLKNKLIAGGLEQAKNFSWEKAARQYSALLNE
ncbi:MAG: glycosyltransferase family 1 protein [bacterium]|nr:glycosyltransferase family 1 protein [bacterium]